MPVYFLNDGGKREQYDSIDAAVRRATETRLSTLQEIAFAIFETDGSDNILKPSEISDVCNAAKRLIGANECEVLVSTPKFFGLLRERYVINDLPPNAYPQGTRKQPYALTVPPTNSTFYIRPTRVLDGKEGMQLSGQPSFVN